MASDALALIFRPKLKVIRNAKRDANIRKNAYKSEGLNCRHVAGGGGGCSRQRVVVSRKTYLDDKKMGWMKNIIE